MVRDIYRLPQEPGKYVYNRCLIIVPDPLGDGGNDVPFELPMQVDCGE